MRKACGCCLASPSRRRLGGKRAITLPTLHFQRKLQLPSNPQSLALDREPFDFVFYSKAPTEPKRNGEKADVVAIRRYSMTRLVQKSSTPTKRLHRPVPLFLLSWQLSLSKANADGMRCCVGWVGYGGTMRLMRVDLRL